jgi:hypothetical protein
VRKDPNWKPSRTQNDRKRGMELTIRREGKAITKLEKDLVAYRKSLDVLAQMNRKQGSTAAASTSTDAMDEEQRDAAADKQVSAVPNARFMSSDEVDESLVQRYGSKMAHLFVYVKELVENDDSNRVIIFSQWDKMLGHVGTHTARHDTGGNLIIGDVHTSNFMQARSWRTTASPPCPAGAMCTSATRPSAPSRTPARRRTSPAFSCSPWFASSPLSLPPQCEQCG